MVKESKIKKIAIAAIAIVVIIAALLLCRFVLFKGGTKEKTSFSSFETSVVRSELCIPTDRYTISEMKYTNAKDKSFNIIIESSTIDILKDSYEYRGKSGEDKDYYKCSSNSDISCYVSKQDNVYNMEFVVDNYNKDLLEIM